MRRDHRNRTPAVTALLLFLGAALVLRGGPAAAAGDAGSIWGADYFPNIPLVSHEGKPVRFFDDLIKGKVVAINFIYTSCPDVCPLEIAILRDNERKILAGVAFARLDDVAARALVAGDELPVAPVVRARILGRRGWVSMPGPAERPCKVMG